MRPIKFRAWIPLDKIMVDNPIAHWNDGDINYAFSECSISQGDEVIFMQFTGLKDKNGKEIFEGDKVTGLFNEKRNTIYYVYFHQEVLAWFLHSETDMNIHLCDLSEIEIIGNLYESPELLSN